MNIEQLIYQIEKRPGMYADDFDLKLIKHFVNGFMCNSLNSGKADEIDIVFFDKFHNWVKERLQIEYKSKFQTAGDYYFYITQVCKKKEELNIFFKLCHEFFSEVHCNTNL